MAGQKKEKIGALLLLSVQVEGREVKGLVAALLNSFSQESDEDAAWFKWKV